MPRTEQEKVTRHDGLISLVVQDCRNVQDLLDSFFGFLLRKTDFFYDFDPNKNIGFPNETAEQILINCYKKYKAIFDESQTLNEADKCDLKIADVENTYDKKNKILECRSGQNECQLNKPKSEPTASTQNISTKEVEPHVEPRRSRVSTWNGGTCDKYSWTQSITDLTVDVYLPHKCKGNDVNVELNPRSILVFFRGQKLLEGKTRGFIVPDECDWCIEEGTSLCLFLKKRDEIWWDSVLVGDPQIDTTKVESTKKLSDFDSETQEHIRRMIIAEHEKNKL